MFGQTATSTTATVLVKWILRPYLSARELTPSNIQKNKQVDDTQNVSFKEFFVMHCILKYVHYNFHVI